jgi:hypothetical protein
VPCMRLLRGLSRTRQRDQRKRQYVVLIFISVSELVSRHARSTSGRRARSANFS